MDGEDGRIAERIDKLLRIYFLSGKCFCIVFCFVSCIVHSDLLQFEAMIYESLNLGDQKLRILGNAELHRLAALYDQKYSPKSKGDAAS